ncbi:MULTISPECIES: alpha/beta hydrolase [Bacillaceae]|uniref:Alpha/beta fold hydrolase n=1 Tax=Evansella alkalicola TaxID=745819 RepID=A0ABS6JYD0_9BACI|nr:alpha/beta fold hydrolase [Litchfieldia alkalitelluris]MBU9722217.1 alpha/beta fold hydrolase [Bacillus alkalicola]
MIGCLVLHGFSGTPDEVEAITSHLEKRHWLVYCPTLPGHGSKDGLKGVTYKHWIYAAEVAAEELLKRCEKVYVIGFSMGGMIASYIASKYPVEKLVLLSTAAFYINPRQLVQDVAGWVLEGLRGELEDDKLYQFYMKKVKETPIIATKEFSIMVRKLRPHLKNVKIPTLIIQGESDGLVPPKKSAEFIYEQIQSKEKRVYYFPKAKHYIWFGEDKEDLLKRIDDFLLTKNKVDIEEGEGN